MSPKLEKVIVKEILEYLNELDTCYATKTHGNSYTYGQPDILGCLKGRALAFEAKRPGNKATKLQLKVLDKWKNAGALSLVVYDVEDVIKAIREE